MVATWIEAAAKGRHGGPVRAGMWSAVVVGTHPIEADQEVWLEISADDVALGPLPAYWIENKGVNSLWHVPIPPQAVGVRLHYRSAARGTGSEPVYSPSQDTIVRPNLPDRTESAEIVAIESRGAGRQPDDDRPGRRAGARPTTSTSRPSASTPTSGPPRGTCRRAGRTSARSSAAWRSAAGSTGSPSGSAWEAFQHYQGATNLLMTELTWRNGPIRVLATDFVAMGDVPAQDGRRDRVARPVHQAVPDHQRGDRAAAAPCSACTSRPRSTAGSASRA